MKYFKWGLIGAAIYGVTKVMQNGMFQQFTNMNSSKSEEDNAAAVAADSVFPSKNE
ncbi:MULTISPECIES: hypothetical protein [unclassified Lysinibacillus]|uniref:hypothetical protein n=1 Tax=unclassified Lysinibacillus TaxID=2636778 RepID=UPI00131F058F|nr:MULTISPECIES: hypothetical protein [unclassified Lysinibacillus]